jgi:cysteine synthase
MSDHKLLIANSAWVRDAIKKIHADFRRSADTHLLQFKLHPDLEARGVRLYLKDESTHPTGSLKHRLARSLFLYALCNGKITGADTKVYEASSGSTAISEAYFARLIGLKDFIAIVPEGTAETKVQLVRDYGGKVEAVGGPDYYRAARELAERNGGYFLDQFTFSERATDWRGNNNIAETIFSQLDHEEAEWRTPQWVVCGAGTGGTSATLGRYARYMGHATRVCVVDPPDSVYSQHWGQHQGSDRFGPPRSVLYLAPCQEPEEAELIPLKMEGIGRPIVADSFIPEVIDAMMQVSHEASLGAMMYLYGTGRYYCGPSTGTNLFGAITLLDKMLREGVRGSVVTLICDSGLRYKDTCYTIDLQRDEADLAATNDIARAKLAALNAINPLDATTVFDAVLAHQYMDAIRLFVEEGVPLDPILLQSAVVADFGAPLQDYRHGLSGKSVRNDSAISNITGG